MALFESASNQFVKDSGRSSLHSVLDLNSASQCRILCVIERKKSRWFWRATKFLPTPFLLNELLTEPVDIKGKTQESAFITNYKNNPQFHVSGKLGAKIATELGIDLSTTDSFVVNMNIGTVNKTEIRWEDMHTILKNKKLNLEHEFVSNIMKSKRRSLCLVCEMLTTAGETTLQSELIVEGDADVETSGIPKVSGKAEGKVTDSHQRSFNIPKDTVLGYGCYRLKVDGDGLVEIAVDGKLKDVTDSTDAAPSGHHQFDEPDGQNDAVLKAEFRSFLESKLHDKIIGCFKKILASPNHIRPLRNIFEDALHSFEGETRPARSVADFRASMGSCEGWEELLSLIGFKVPKGNDGNVELPSNEWKTIVWPCTAIAESLIELSDAQCLAIKGLTPEYLEPLLYLMKNAMYGRSTKENDPQLKRIYTHAANPGKKFLLALGFVKATENGDSVLTFKAEPLASLEDAYVATFVMCQE